MNLRARRLGTCAAGKSFGDRTASTPSHAAGRPRTARPPCLGERAAYAHLPALAPVDGARTLACSWQQRRPRRDGCPPRAPALAAEYTPLCVVSAALLAGQTCASPRAPSSGQIGQFYVLGPTRTPRQAGFLTPL